MVDISHKDSTIRVAKASGKVILGGNIIAQLSNGEIHTKKGAVFSTAIIAATMAVKKTSDLIPFCHPLMINGCKVNINVEGDCAYINCEVKISGKTGVEMEALTGVTAAALTIYDMCKALSHEIKITDIELIKKTGGKSDYEKVSK